MPYFPTTFLSPTLQNNRLPAVIIFAFGVFFMKLKRLFAFFLAVAIYLAVPAYAAQVRTITVDPINVMVGGSVFLPTDVNGNNVPVFVYNGTTYAPLRALAEAYGLGVSYNPERKLACIT